MNGLNEFTILEKEKIKIENFNEKLQSFKLSSQINDKLMIEFLLKNNLIDEAKSLSKESKIELKIFKQYSHLNFLNKIKTSFENDLIDETIRLINCFNKEFFCKNYEILIEMKILKFFRLKLEDPVEIRSFFFDDIFIG